MAIQLDHNPYPGVNAHLNSFLQEKSAYWQSFHAEYIVRIREALDLQLPAGYFTLPENSLQLDEIILTTKPHFASRSDVTIYQQQPTTGAALPSADLPTSTLDLEDSLLADVELPGLVIYRADEATDGTPVTRIELLSPANKPGGSHYRHYNARRYETLTAGLNLVELDWLHTTKPIIRGVPRYQGGDRDAVPYYIAISIPRPSLQEGVARIYGFGVDRVFPRVVLPLAENDAVVFDFGDPYRRAIAGNRFYKQAIDYEQLPLAFDRYHPADQERIRAVMAQIAAEHGNTHDA